MTTGGPTDPRRRALIRTLSLVGVAVVSSTGARFLFGRLDGPSEQAAPSPSTPSSTSTTTPPPTSPPLTTAATAVSPEPIVIQVISKEGWGGGPTGEFQSHEIVRLTYHHTASSGSDPAGAPDRIRGYQKFHQAQEWPDMAYHYLIDQAGRIYEGRPVDAVGNTFTEYDPTGHFLTCLDGDFDVEQPSPESINALATMLAWASKTYGIVPQTLSGHRDHAVTTCPGGFAYEMRDELVSRVEALLAGDRPIELHLVDAIPEPDA